MKVAVVNGVEYKGCNYHIKEIFLAALKEKFGEFELTEYNLPSACPVFCTGCKACFYKDISVCPHRQYTNPIWESLVNADLLVFSSPVYVFHASAQLKALLDHYASKWMAHSPDERMFFKRAVILTNAAGMGMSKAVKDIGDSLNYWGVGRTYSLKYALFMGEWKDVAEKTKETIRINCLKLASKLAEDKAAPGPGAKSRFYILRMAQKMINKTLIKRGFSETKDHAYWKEKGWLGKKRPWKAQPLG
jgi:Multimeric flavodoxin WrbA